MDRTGRATQIFCMLIKDKYPEFKFSQMTNGEYADTIYAAVKISYDIEKAVLDEEQRRARED